MGLQDSQISKSQSLAPLKSGATSSSTAPQPSSGDSSKQYAIMPSMLYLLVESMLDGAKSWLEQMKEAFEFAQKTVLTMAGGEEQANGSWKVDINNGLIAETANALTKSGEEAATATKMDAYGNIANAGANAVATGFTIGHGIADSRQTNKLEAENERIDGFKTQFDEAPTSPQAGGGTSNSNNAMSANDKQVLEQWKGQRDFDFQGPVDKSLATKIKTENGEDLKAIRSNIQQRFEKNQAQIGRIEQKAIQRNQTYAMRAQIVTNATTAGVSFPKADAQEAQIKEQAISGLFDSNGKTMDATYNDLKKQAATYQENAGQQTASMGSFGGGMAKA